MPLDIFRHYQREPNRRSEVAYNRAFTRFAIFGETQRVFANMPSAARAIALFLSASRKQS